MFNRVELKQQSWEQLRGKWEGGVLLGVIYMLICIGVGILGLIPVLGSIAPILITAPLVIGYMTAFVRFARNNDRINFEDLFKGFNIYGKSLGIVLWVDLWVSLWSLLFVIPGIIKGLSYSMSCFIIADNPNVKVRDAMKISMKMTDGFKMDIFVMGLSFIGWYLLGMLSLGIGFLWIHSYMATSFANMYLKLKELSIERGVCTEEMFNGTVSLT